MKMLLWEEMLIPENPTYSSLTADLTHFITDRISVNSFNIHQQSTH